MSIEKQIWDHLIAQGMTAAGAAGLMGNLYAESGLIPGRVEMLCLKRLKEHGKIYTDETYTAAVDSGKISRAEFLNPLPGKQYGYGLAQWTSPGRKGALYDFVKAAGVSIADAGAQLDYLVYELNVNYKSVLNVLKTAKTVKEASDIVLVKYESPANCGASVKATRASYGQKYYDKYAKGDNTMSCTPDKVITIAKAEDGYLEKRSNSQLDSKTANAGSSNYTKYWRDLANWGLGNYQAQYWCAAFVHWCFVKAFGLAAAKKLLLHAPYISCDAMAAKSKAAGRRYTTPKIGDVVVFWNGSRYSHTGIVYQVSGGYFYTIEGNTSGASGVISNGGGVVVGKKYKIAGTSHRFHRPAYDSTAAETPDTGINATKGDTAYMFKCKTIQNGSQGNDVLLAEEILKARGYYKGELDRSFGPQMTAATRAYQTDRKGGAGPVDGIIGEKCWADLIAL